MSVATVVLCPPLPGDAAAYDGAVVAAALQADGRLSTTRVLVPEVPAGEPSDDERTRAAHWVAHLSIELMAAGAAAPVLLVVGGSAGALAPALGFAQRASRRAVAGYVLVDASTPPAESRGGDWPDAPVWLLASPSADALEVNQARLRGWTVLELADATSATLAAALSALASD